MTITNPDRLAFDRAAVSVRSKDIDGRLHVEVSPISKAAVNGYLGKEIPGCETLGLQPDRIYMLYRDPEELARGAQTFCGVPVLNRHIPVSAASPQKDAIIGATGSSAYFEAPYLKSSLVIWDAEAIALIESGEQKEISSAYRYTPDFTPGEVDGEKFDAVMRNIVANHVAVVPKGRAGPDVVVGDAALPNPTEPQETRRMAKRILSLKAATALSTLADFLRPKLAQDAELEDIIKLLDTLEPDPEAKDEDPVDPTKDPNADMTGDEGTEGKKDEEQKPGPENKSEEKKDGEGGSGGEETVTKGAMDAAITAAVKAAEENTVKRLRAAREAEREVEPWVGKLAVAMDSADAVFEAALSNLGVDVKGVHPSAYPHILKAQPRPGSHSSNPRLAADSASGASDFSKRFPDAAKIRRI